MYEYLYYITIHTTKRNNGDGDIMNTRYSAAIIIYIAGLYTRTLFNIICLNYIGMKYEH